MTEQSAQKTEWKCRCGNEVMFADTEDWDEPLCYTCYCGYVVYSKPTTINHERKEKND